MEQVDDDGVDKFTKLLVPFIFKLPDDIENLEDDDVFDRNFDIKEEDG